MVTTERVSVWITKQIWIRIVNTAKELTIRITAKSCHWISLKIMIVVVSEGTLVHGLMHRCGYCSCRSSRYNICEWILFVFFFFFWRLFILDVGPLGATFTTQKFFLLTHDLPHLHKWSVARLAHDATASSIRFYFLLQPNNSLPTL